MVETAVLAREVQVLSSLDILHHQPCQEETQAAAEVQAVDIIMMLPELAALVMKAEEAEALTDMILCFIQPEPVEDALTSLTSPTLLS